MSLYNTFPNVFQVRATNNLFIQRKVCTGKYLPGVFRTDQTTME